MNHRTDHTLVIKNQSSKVVILPNFSNMNGGDEDPNIAVYVRQQVLQLQVKRGSDIMLKNAEWQYSSKYRQHSIFKLQPGKELRVPFSLTREWHPSFYTLTTPGKYTVTVTLDTTDIPGYRILRGKFTSQPATFKIIPVASFREKRYWESQQDYAKKKTEFYLKRIASNEGSYYKNVWELLKTKESVPALIGAADSEDDECARLAYSILGNVYQNGGRISPHLLPQSNKEWMEWWKREGEALPFKEIWARFDSHYQ